MPVLVQVIQISCELKINVQALTYASLEARRRERDIAIEAREGVP